TSSPASLDLPPRGFSIHAPKKKKLRRIAGALEKPARGEPCGHSIWAYPLDRIEGGVDQLFHPPCDGRLAEALPQAHPPLDLHRLGGMGCSVAVLLDAVRVASAVSRGRRFYECGVGRFFKGAARMGDSL